MSLPPGTQSWIRGGVKPDPGSALGKGDPSQSVETEETILKGIKILEELKLKPYQAEGQLHLGELYADTGQNETALKALRKAKRMFKARGMDHSGHGREGAGEAESAMILDVTRSRDSLVLPSQCR